LTQTATTVMANTPQSQRRRSKSSFIYADHVCPPTLAIAAAAAA